MSPSPNGTLNGIAIRDASRAPMTVLDQAEVSTERGVADDFRGQQRSRQVTVLFEDAWQAACDELETELPWTVRRANLLLRNVSFHPKFDAERVVQGTYTIRVGDVILQATKETEPCHRMDEQQAGLRQALTPNWRGGLCCKVIQSGTVRMGDTVTIDA